MYTRRGIIESVKYYRIARRVELKDAWEQFLVSEWAGETYNDFTLLSWLNNRSRNNGLRIGIFNTIQVKKRAQLENLRLRGLIKDERTQKFRIPHYQAMIWHKRMHIDKLNEMILKKLEGE